MRFTQFVGIDWSGAKGTRHPSIQIAVCDAGTAAPQLVRPAGGVWSRGMALDWLSGLSGNVLVGMDAGFGFASVPPFTGPARALWAEAGLIVGVTVFVWFARPLVVTVGLVMVGTAPKDALRTGLTGTPIGEFSFIIAQLGVGAALVPAKFYPVAVGVSLLTTLVAPGLTRHSAWIADWVLARQPSWLAAWQGYYYGWLERFRREQLRNQLWQLSRARIGQKILTLISRHTKPNIKNL
jgi:hypothetical protein